MKWRNLVVVRAGRNSLHPKWLENAEGRIWDLIVSYYDDTEHEHPADVRVVRQKGGKWDGLHVLLAGSDILDRYDYIWLPDDDILTSCQTINEMFRMMARYDLAVAQPSLRRDSYFTHFIFNRCPGFLLRFTNFVEIMVPCLRADVLRTICADMKETRSGFGLDYVWCRLEGHTHRKCAILDGIEVCHTRPVGVHLRGEMQKQGILPEDEEARLRLKYGIADRPLPVIYAALRSDGRSVSGKRYLGLLMARAYLGVLPTFRSPRLALRKIWQLLKRQFSRPVDLSPVRRRELGDVAFV